MIQSRSLEPIGDLCCLPSPYRVPHSVAGMAFNFSKVELAHHGSQRNAPMQAEKTQRGPADSTLVKTRRSCFGIPQYSPAT
jgi:hypothetical protein